MEHSPASTAPLSRHILAALRPSTGLKVAHAVGLTSTAFLAGQSWAQSCCATPALLQAPAPLLVEQWLRMYKLSLWVRPAIVLGSSSIFAYLAYVRLAWDAPRMLYTTSASLMLGLIPYSIALLEPISQQLEKKGGELAASVSPAEQESVHYLVDRWAIFDAGRAVIISVAAGCAIWATLGQIVEVVAIAPVV